MAILEDTPSWDDGSSTLQVTPSTMNTSSSRLHARGNGPQNFRLTGHVDIFIDDHHQLDVGIETQQQQGRVTPIARSLLREREIAVVMRAVRGVADACHIGKHFPQFRRTSTSFCTLTEQQVVTPVWPGHTSRK